MKQVRQNLKDAASFSDVVGQLLFLACSKRVLVGRLHGRQS